MEKEKEMSAAQEKEPDTSGHDVQKSEPGQAEMEQPKPEPAQTEQPKPEKEEHQETERPEPEQEETPDAKQAEPQSEQNKPEKTDKIQLFEDMEDEDEIIDLGDEKDQVLAQMKKSLKGEQETELAFQIADRFISIQEVDGGYDYSIMGADYKEIDGGVYDNPDVSIREALDDILTDLKDNPFDNGARGNIRDNDELIPIDYDGLMEKAEAANAIEPQAQGTVVENFKAKTNELFHEISEMNPAEIEETVKCHVQAQLDESGIDAEIVDVAVVGSRCRGLEQEGSDLDVAVELSTSEREDVLFDTFNGDALHIGGVKVDINPITAQRTGTLETYLPQVEDYLEGVREAREKEPVSLSQEQAETEVTLTVAECGEFHNLG
ncbi:MAG: nucleotidyltransferase domain-containing protein, partial [Lachnospiraceae bacterium]|nr:nucleotidyltransferase domain-containing protein [Lachnospiraceae bacterium]